MNLSICIKKSAIIACLIISCHFSNLNAQGAQAQLPREKNTTEDTNTSNIRPQKTDQTSEKIIENFLEVSGGESSYANLRSVKATGTVVEAGRSKTFELIETQKGQRRLTYSWKHLGRNYKTIHAFDGVHIWQKELLPKEKHPEQLEGLSAKHFAGQRWLIQPVVIPLKASFTFKYQGKSKVSGRPAYLIAGFGKNNERSWFYFDQETFLLTRWGGKTTLAGIEEYIDYRATEFAKVEGVLLPKKVDILAEDSPFGTITFETVTANLEVDSTIFYMPQNKIPTLRQVNRSNSMN
ncbi:MAG: hypothetical protein ACJAT5_000045 [Lentimonas sp.]|jgi:hypothetical protein